MAEGELPCITSEEVPGDCHDYVIKGDREGIDPVVGEKERKDQSDQKKKG
jgi:hypothetical protein